MVRKVMICGSMFTHDCVRQDYCLKEAVLSLLGICEQVSIVDAESSDGTVELLESIGDSRLKISHQKWKPTLGGLWLSDLANEARSKLPQDSLHVNVQADEVLHPEDYEAIKSLSKRPGTYACHRLNFWKDPYHLVPHGQVVGHLPVRIGKASVPFAGDAESLDIQSGYQTSKVRIFHYGFLRKTEALIAKGKAMEMAVFGCYNPIFDMMEKENSRSYFDNAPNITGELVRIDVDHPPLMKRWLTERGYAV